MDTKELNKLVELLKQYLFLTEKVNDFNPLFPRSEGTTFQDINSIMIYFEGGGAYNYNKEYLPVFDFTAFDNQYMENIKLSLSKSRKELKELLIEKLSNSDL